VPSGSGIARKPTKDWWETAKDQLERGDLEEVEGISVSQFHINDESKIVVVLKAQYPPSQASTMTSSPIL
jgi:hypothetical protein